MNAPKVLRVGTRASRLAQHQTDRIAERLAAAAPDVRTEIVLITTEGDRDRATPLRALGGTGVFTDALVSALRDGRIDVAVHSLKDLPIDGADDVVVAAVCQRDDVRDVVVSRGGVGLAVLPAGARVGTCSTRRTAQLLAVRPDVRVGDIRGNVETRLRKVDDGEFDAILLAAAGLHRLGRAGAIAEYLPLSDFLPAPGQAALAVQCRASDASTRSIVALLDDEGAHRATDAERSFLGALGGGCAAPVAAFAEIRPAQDGATLAMRGVVASHDGRTMIRVHGDGDAAAPAALGIHLAALARERGAEALLA